MIFWHWTVAWYCLMNVVGAALYAVDKNKAKKHHRRIPERVLIMTAVLGGGAGCLLAMLACHHKTRKKKFTITVPVMIALHLALIIFCTYQNNHLVTSHYQLDTGVGLRIVQISDLHNTTIMWDEDRIADETEKLDPDIIVITGDIIDANHTDIDSAVDTARKLAGIADTYYVTGNHEYMVSDDKREELEVRLEDCGVTVLDNDYVIGEGRDLPFALIGLDDDSLEDDTLAELVEAAREEGGEDVITIVLAHEPQYLGQYRAAGADVVFAGHAHGGQADLPLTGPLYAPGQGMRPRYTSGVYTSGDTYMIVSRGIGNSVLPIRINNYPEIVVADI